jgi:hypothetical protein
MRDRRGIAARYTFPEIRRSLHNMFREEAAGRPRDSGSDAIRGQGHVLDLDILVPKRSSVPKLGELESDRART